KAGIFDKNGRAVQLVHAEGNVAVMGLLSGNFSISQVAGPAVVNSALKGSDVVYLAGGMRSLNYYLMGRPEIKSRYRSRGSHLSRQTSKSILLKKVSTQLTLS